MNTKKIWLLAILFGLTMSAIFYIVTTNTGNTTQTVMAKSPDPEEDTLEEENVLPTNPTLEIANGKRAISIAVDEVQSVSGFVRPGSIVDIIAILPSPTGDQKSSEILLENIKVLAVGKTLVSSEGENQEPYQMITVEVNPTEGVSLAHAKDVGTVILMLKGTKE
ncbi:Flp pilus assembly protein CpaB [Bacillus sp. Marseille-P3661]|uniref:Flp pilus assembly protein CpaB n=1 Tax=Bacillus sp. Marseille-P3661 TaxID=1936234 RepID=UPI000C82D1C7|nr:Flp pilus assembly protein CpaB [Bacillus sp. Marseille-P3661]